MTAFDQFSLDPTILEALEKIQYKEASPVQAAAIPIILEGKDLIALAKTGSGKTAACAIPICHKVDPSQPHIQALILVPTRELSLQYATETQKIGSKKGVKTFAILGGEDMGVQLAKLKAGVQVLIATPGRLIDLIYQRLIDLTYVRTLVLDEADEMLGMGFYDDLEFIINCLVHEHQTLLFSATMPKQIRQIAHQHMKSPEEITLTQGEVSPETIRHQFLYCRHDQKSTRLLKLLNELDYTQCIIFCGARHQVEKISHFLQRKVPCVDLLHGGMGQDLRSIITNKFRQAKVKVMVATDVAARGLDFSGVSHVVIYDLSSDVDTYLHRAGRTGRYDKHGVVISFVADRELRTVPLIEKRIQRAVEWLEEPPRRQQSKVASKEEPKSGPAVAPKKRPAPRTPRAILKPPRMPGDPAPADPVASESSAPQKTPAPVEAEATPLPVKRRAPRKPRKPPSTSQDP